MGGLLRERAPEFRLRDECFEMLVELVAPRLRVHLYVERALVEDEGERAACASDSSQSNIK